MGQVEGDQAETQHTGAISAIGLLSFLVLGSTALQGQAASRKIVVAERTIVARVGQAVSGAGFAFSVRDAQDMPVAGAATSLSALGAGLEVSGGETATDAAGHPTFTTLTFRGQAGVHRVIVTVGSISEEFALDLKPGDPYSVEIVGPTPTATISDSILRPKTTVRVRDASGNPVPNAGISAMLSWQLATARRHPTDEGTYGPMKDGLRVQKARQIAASSTSDDTPGGMPRLAGAVAQVTNADGLATFEDLQIVGGGGYYFLEFASSDGKATITSAAIRYLPDELFDRSYVVVSAIKSIAGVKPENEFFDLRFRFRIHRRWSALAGVDLALTNRDTDSVSSSTKALSEANVSLNYDLYKFRQSDDIPRRSLLVGVVGARIFNSVPYLGPHIGSVELGGSAFQGSQLTVAILSRFNSTTIVASGDTISSAQFNLYMDFFVRSSTIPFFKALNARGGILLPLKKGNTGFTTRLTIAVPVGTLDWF